METDETQADPGAEGGEQDAEARKCNVPCPHVALDGTHCLYRCGEPKFASHTHICPDHGAY